MTHDDDHDDAATTDSATTEAATPALPEGRMEGLLCDPGVRAALAQAPLVLNARSGAHRFYWALLLHESGTNPFQAPGRPMRAPRGRS